MNGSLMKSPGEAPGQLHDVMTTKASEFEVNSNIRYWVAFLNDARTQC